MKLTYLRKADIKSVERVQRLQLVNSLSGFKSANLIASLDEEGHSNLAIFSSVIHLGSNPALLGFIMRPPTVERHTYENILKTQRFTINHVHGGMIEKAHYTAVKLEKGQSEFKACGLTEQIMNDWSVPYVRESRLKMGLTLIDDVPIEANGTRLIIGEIEHLYVEGSHQRKDGSFDLEAIDTVCISGVGEYHSVAKGLRMPHPRLEEMPAFEMESRRPDAVAYDEKTGKYNASLLPYATEVSGPRFDSSDLTMWKNNSVGKVSAHFKTRFEEIKSEYNKMVEQYSWNEVVYSAKLNFEPVVGQIYHLYHRDNGERFMSMIPPSSWKRECMGSFQLNTEKMWLKIEDGT